MTVELSADDVVRLLDLSPHPEGGYFRETFRDAALPGSARAASTAIYFLLRQSEISRWHRIDVAEVWHWYAGAPLELTMCGEGGPLQPMRLGPGLSEGERPQAVVPPGFWQSARSTGAWTLVGCTVAPGFEFSHFEMTDATFDPTM